MKSSFDLQKCRFALYEANKSNNSDLAVSCVIRISSKFIAPSKAARLHIFLPSRTHTFVHLIDARPSKTELSTSRQKADI